MSDAGAPTHSVGTIAKLLLLSERRVQQLTTEGVIPKAERGRYELAPAVQGYIRYLQDRFVKPADGSGDIDYHKEKARLTKAQADRTELDAAEIRGELVRADHVIESWSRMLGSARARLLSIPSKAAPRVRAAANDEEAASLIESEVLEALEELSSNGLPERSRAR